MNYFWKGEKIKLRAIEDEDLEKYFCNGEEIDTKAQRNGDRLLFPVSKSIQKVRIAELAKSTPTSVEDFFLIIEDLEGNAVGNINTHSCNRINGTFSYGIGVREKYRGKGYASEAIKILLKFYFEELRYRKANVKLYEFNNESKILHEKFGFTLEGTMRKEHFTMGKFWDMYCYGMLREEFEEKYN